MSNYREEILEIINTKSLPAEDVELWGEVIKNTPEEYCSSILEALKSSPDSIKILTNNVKEKMAALESLDPKEWERVLKKEVAWNSSVGK